MLMSSSLLVIILVFAMFTQPNLCKVSLWNDKLIREFFRAKLCNVGTLLYCKPDKAEILKVVKDLMEPSVVFRISAFDVSNRNIKATDLVLPKHRHYNLAVVLNIDCENVEDFLNECFNLRLFYDTHRWLIFGSDGFKVFEKIKQTGININADITIALPDIQESDQHVLNWTLHNVYNRAYNHGGDYKFEKIGFFNEEEGYRVVPGVSKYFDRRNMTGTLFTSVMVVPENVTMPLEQYVESINHRFNNTVSRFHNSLVKVCQAYYNFTNNETLMHSWGYQQPNGEVDGMLGELKEKRVDFGTAPVMFKLYRLIVADYSIATGILRSTFVFQHPKSTSSSSEIYLRPLVESVWFAVIGIIAIVVIILKIIMGLQNKTVHPQPSTDNEYSWSFLVLYGIGEVCQQGYAYIPYFISGKIVTVIFILFSYLIYQFYSANIVSLLLLDPPKTIETLEDLYKSQLKIGCEDTLFDRDYFKKTNNPVAIKLYKSKMISDGNHSSFFQPIKGLKKVKKGGFAFHAQTSSSYPIIENTFPEEIICKLTEVQMYSKEYTYMVTQKHSPYKEMFNYCLQRQAETGVMERMRSFWYARRPVCVNPINYLEIEVEIGDTSWGLIILCCGFIASLAVLGVELFLAKHENHVECKMFKKRYRKSLANNSFFH